MAITWEPYFLTLMWIDFALCAFVFLITWRIARRFGWRGLAVVVVIAAVIGPPRDSWFMERFPEWGAYAPGAAPLLVISATYVLLGVVGHGVMRLVAGPAGADRLARQPCPVVQMLDSHSDRALEARRNAANSWVHAAVWVAIVALWLCPMGLFLYALWNDGRPFSMLGCAVCMSVSLLAFFLPAGYYRPRRFELSGRLYERLGVRWFKRWTPNGDYVVGHIRRFLPDYKVIPSRGGLGEFDVRTRTNEQGHLLWMLVTVPAMLYSVFCGWAVLASWLFLGNLIVNVYPIFVQRYNRARIQKSLDRSFRTKKTDAARRDDASNSGVEADPPRD